MTPKTQFEIEECLNHLSNCDKLSRTIGFELSKSLMGLEETVFTTGNDYSEAVEAYQELLSTYKSLRFKIFDLEQKIIMTTIKQDDDFELI